MHNDLGQINSSFINVMHQKTNFASEFSCTIHENFKYTIFLHYNIRQGIFA